MISKNFLDKVENATWTATYDATTSKVIKHDMRESVDGIYEIIMGLDSGITMMGITRNLLDEIVQEI